MCLRVFQKVGTFSKGVSPWFWSKIGNFSMFLLYAKQARKMCLRIFQEEKKPFQTIKTRSYKCRKTGIFPRGQSTILVKNGQFFHLFIIAKTGHENLFENILESKKSFREFKNKKLRKSANWDFSKRVIPWFWSKIGNFSIVLLQTKQAREMCQSFQTIKARSKSWNRRGFNLLQQK